MLTDEFKEGRPKSIVVTQNMMLCGNEYYKIVMLHNSSYLRTGVSRHKSSGAKTIIRLYMRIHILPTEGCACRSPLRVERGLCCVNAHAVGGEIKRLPHNTIYNYHSSLTKQPPGIGFRINKHGSRRPRTNTSNLYGCR
ncbi:hypothetical protein EVAR_22835_1 [Eumeta japonica]|uniref:Uncharacterized protein n=1 Tax=Eumeta variegata TaxID=151549 RepID=A0A4C1VFH2_EUMVA|nr:hypothetical protein EVAR_22835_1 [Eumeta japonica]